MEGPTPVSALLHAATMVTAGVFLIIRSSPIFEYSSFCLFLIALFGGLTAFFFSFSAIMQFDLKKVIAYSTCSQLGYMFLACGLSFYNVGLFHLFNHAFFKALLFLSAGAIIHALNDEQDMRRMGGLVNFLPFTFFCMLFGSLAIMGFPFLTGFYSKDLLLELLLGSYKVDFLFFYFLALMAAFFTATYSLRLLLMVFFFRPNFFLISLPTESHGFISISLFSLAFFSLIFGYLFSDLFVGWGSFFSFFALPANVFPLEALLLSPLERNLPLIFSLAGSLISTGFLIFFHEKPTINLVQNNFFKNVYGGFLRGLAHLSAFFYFSGFFNVVYNRVFINFYKFSYKLDTKLIDKGLLEFLGPVGFYRFFYNISRRVWAINSSVFLNIGFMMFFFILFYIYIIFSQGFLLFHVVHYGALVVGLLAVYNEFTPSL
jgi:NADH-ubiquinone oxidoreductase chain 5